MIENTEEITQTTALNSWATPKGSVQFSLSGAAVEPQEDSDLLTKESHLLSASRQTNTSHLMQPSLPVGKIQTVLQPYITLPLQRDQRAKISKQSFNNEGRLKNPFLLELKTFKTNMKEFL